MYHPLIVHVHQPHSNVPELLEKIVSEECDQRWGEAIQVQID